MEQLAQEVLEIQGDVEQLDDQLDAGFENYEEILVNLSDTIDELNGKLRQLASAVIDLREQVGEVAQADGQRAALTRLSTAANQQGVETAKCESCDGSVDISLLTEPRCPHCQTAFSSLEAKRGFFRTSVLQTGSVPALESGDEGSAADDGLASIAEADEDATEVAPFRGTQPAGDEGAEGGRADEPGAAETSPTGANAAADGSGDVEEPAQGQDHVPEPDDEVAAGQDDRDRKTTEPASADGDAGGTGDLQTIDGIGPKYAERLQSAGIESLPALAVADPDQLAEAIDVHAWTIAKWIEEAATRIEGP